MRYYSREYFAYIPKTYGLCFLSQSTTVIPQQDRGLSRKTPRSIGKDIGFSLKNRQQPRFFRWMEFLYFWLSF